MDEGTGGAPLILFMTNFILPSLLPVLLKEPDRQSMSGISKSDLNAMVLMIFLPPDRCGKVFFQGQNNGVGKSGSFRNPESVTRV
jgi:hypothetical protein